MVLFDDPVWAGDFLKFNIAWREEIITSVISSRPPCGKKITYLKKY